MILETLLRLVGASLVVLSVGHGVLGRALNWPADAAKMSPLNARVFHAHTFFVAYVLMLLGLLSLVRPDLMLIPSDLGRLLLGGIEPPPIAWTVSLCCHLLELPAHELQLELDRAHVVEG
jgi:hypothetical protein